MKKIIFLTLFIIPFLGISQVVVNGDFTSTDISDWKGHIGNTNDNSIISHDATEGSAALGSLKLIAGAGTNYRIQTQNAAPALAGDYLMTVMVKGTASNKVQLGRFQSGNAGGNSDTSSNITLATSDWEEVSFLFTGIEVSNMNLRVINKTASSTIFIDDVSFVKVSSVTENSFVANPDFETAPITDAWTMNFTDTDLSTVTGNGGGSAAQVKFNKDITNQSNNMLLSGVVDFGQTVNPATVDATFDALAKNSNIQIQLSIRTYDAADATLETLNGAAETVAVADTWEPFTFSNAVTKPFNKIIFRIRIKGALVVTDDYAAVDNITATFTYNQSRNYWLDVDTDWANTANWTYGTIPVATDIVHIETGATNDPIIGATTGAVANNLIVDSGESLTIASGGSLIVSGTSTGNVSYQVLANDMDWHLLSSPVVGATYDGTWVDDNDIDNTTRAVGTNVAIGTYTNTVDADGDWTYATDAAESGTFGLAQGYAIKRDANTNTYVSFSGTVKTDNLTSSINQNTNNWNLKGNPYPSYILVSDLIASNTDDLTATHKNVYVWDNGKTGGAGYDVLATTDYIHPGQGFFVNAANSDSNNFVIDASKLSHQTGEALYKGSSKTLVTLFMNDGKNIKTTEINYSENKTTGLDPSFDAGTFTGESSNLNVYTQLVSNNEGVDFMRQALPNSDLESMIVPVGVDAQAGKELSFSVEALNLPSGIKVYLEDRLLNTFTRIDEANSEYTITLKEASNGAGRFFLHTKTSSVLGLDSDLLNSVSIYNTNRSNLKITGLQKGKTTVSLFNLLGKQVMTTSFDGANVNNISLPNLARGVYVVKLQTEKGKLNKKIVLE